MPISPESRYFLTTDQVKVHYLFRKHANSQHCCLLLHGFTNDAHIFDRLAEKLSQHCSVIALDFRGHGNSDWDPKANYQHEFLMSDVHTLLKQFDFHWHIIGHSLGARVALLAQHQYDLTLQSLTIIDTGPEVSAVGVRKIRQDAERMPKSFEAIDAYQHHLSNIYLLSEPDLIHHMAKHGLKKDGEELIPKTDPAFTKALWKQDSHQGDNNDLNAPKHHDLWESLDSVDCPSLILRGQASAILSQHTATAMQARLKNVQLQTIPNAGHALMLDNPENFEHALLHFIYPHLKS